MRRALEMLDPRTGSPVSIEQRRIVCEAIRQSFSALRETFLEELDLEEPTHGQLVSGARRLKKSGATRRARGRQKQQQRSLARRINSTDDDAVAKLLAEAYAREQSAEATVNK